MGFLSKLLKKAKSRNMRTVDEVVRSMGYEPTPALNWAAGQIIAARWRKATGTEPERELRSKTNPSPSVQAPHMKCIYPEGFHAAMRQVIMDLDPMLSPQDDLFQ